MKRLSLLVFLSLLLPRIIHAHEVLSRAWDYGKKNIYPPALASLFTDNQFLAIKKRYEANGNDIALAFFPFLNSLGVSHTQIYGIQDTEYYLLRSLFSTKDIDSPKLHHIGIQFERQSNGLKVKSLLEGYSAEKSGLRRGDVITQIDHLKAKGVLDFKGKNVVNLTIERSGEIFETKVNVSYESFHRSLLNATKNSLKIIKINNRTLGYVHLWSGTHPQFLEALKDSILSQLYDTDGMILDLRDGAGGAWWEYLDLFYPNRSTYFVAQRINSEGSTDLRADAQTNGKYYSKPIVVLINSNVRSGKEALAYQFKKDKRALLIGSKTAGAFSGGEGGFSSENLNFIFYLSVFELLLDGSKVEGVGISPDIIASDEKAFEIAQEKLIEITR